MFIAGPSLPELLQAPQTLADLLESTARRLPAQPALRWGEQRLTYGELDAAADRVADRLIAQGSAPGRLIGLWAPRGLELLVLQAGIAKSGAGFMPFDADTPLARIQECLQDAGALGLLAGEAFAARAARLPLPVWTASVDPRLATGLRRREGLRPDHLAYVLYTSGSTGKP